MPRPDQPSYDELAGQIAELKAVVAEQAALIEALRAEVAALQDLHRRKTTAVT